MSHDYQLVERAIHLIRTSPVEWSVADLAAELGVSEGHLHRTFVAWAGIPPKTFAQVTIVDQARRLLRQRLSVLDTSIELGLSSQSRLYDAFLTVDHVTPGEYASGGAGMTIETGCVDTVYGPAYLATTERGLVKVTFVDDQNDPVGELRAEWPDARIQEGGMLFEAAAQSLPSHLEDGLRKPLGLVLKGSEFRVAVWRALLRLPRGSVTSYRKLADAVGNPNAVRAVATAVAENPIAAIIPCHRVIRSDGDPGEYHWGRDRKLGMLVREGALGREAKAA